MPVWDTTVPLPAARRDERLRPESSALESAVRVAGFGNPGSVTDTCAWMSCTSACNQASDVFTPRIRASSAESAGTLLALPAPSSHRQLKGTSLSPVPATASCS